MTHIVGLIAALLAGAAPVWADIAVDITWLRLEVVAPPVLSNLDPIPEDLGLAGAMLAVADNGTTGRFLGHAYNLTTVSVPPGGDVVTAAREALARSPLLVVDMDADALLSVADLPEAQGALIIDTATSDARLRSADCRANVLHTGAEAAMRTDALMQVMRDKRWDDMVMITGPRPADQKFAATIRQSAQKYGMQIAAEKAWTFDSDLRLSAAAEVPLFTQEFPDHDVLIVADATDDFARYIPDNTWLPRVVAGAAGMMPEVWSPVLEQWGAVQLQERFEELAGRNMAPRDYAAWVAVRTIGEAVTRTKGNDPATMRAFILSDAFVLDGFKGWPLSFRAWNGQLRQPIAVVNARAFVAMAPLEGFLHQFNELDTLGLDRAESACQAFGG